MAPGRQKSTEFWRCAKCGTPNPTASYIVLCVACGAARIASVGPSQNTHTRSAPIDREVKRKAVSSAGSSKRSALRQAISSWFSRQVTPGGKQRPERMARLIGWVGIAYALFLGLLACFMYLLGDRWWIASLVLFGPRWIWGLPLVLLVPATMWFRPRLVAIPLLSVWLFVVPILGYCFPFFRTAAVRGANRAANLRVLSCNIEYGELESARLGALIASEGPEVVAIQEWSTKCDASRIFVESGWNLESRDQLCFASRFPIVETEYLTYKGLGAWRIGMAARHVVRTPTGDITFFNLHPVSPRKGLEAVRYDLEITGDTFQENIEVRRRQSEVFSEWAKIVDGPKIVAGDFNLPVESRIYRTYWPEFSNAFSEAGSGFGHTWFSRWHGLRIDHILAGPGWGVRKCRVGPDVGSDHRPVIADLVWQGTPPPSATTPP